MRRIDRKGVSIPNVTLSLFIFPRAMTSLRWHGLTFLSKVFRWFFVLYFGLLPWATLAWYEQGYAMRSFYVNDSSACTNGGSAMLSFQNRPVEMIRGFSFST